MTGTLAKPTVLTVAGSDSAGMAGIAVDIRTQTALGVHCALALTANTAQDSNRLLGINALDTEQLQQQLEASHVLQPLIVKAGMLASAAQVRVLCEYLRRHELPLIYDPVLKTTAGHALGEKELAAAVSELLKHCLLLTPNLEEACALTGMSAGSHKDIERMAQRLMTLGAHAVLIKGGHLPGAWCSDYFCSPEHSFWLSSPARNGNVRGTGCALASAIAASLARGYELADAVVIGKMAINQGIRQAYACAEQGRTTHVTAFPDAGGDLPFLHMEAQYMEPLAFRDCGTGPLGLYPVIDRAHWLERLLPLGVTTAQLRIKDLQGQALSQEIERAVLVSRAFACRLFINDYWELAIEHQAYGVHLGQEDLATADLARIREAGLRLGISTHCHYEVARAHALKPSYIACGPIYHTNSKHMPWKPQGVEGLRYWNRVLANYPVVAIGGISLARIRAVAETGTDGIAMITAITEAPDVDAMTHELLAALKEHTASPCRCSPE
jgi:hydroxymethylpyrimidine kinase / phosphomethylpyrimidine kinase / thiamine-phosphate diphosphorylase